MRLQIPSIRYYPFPPLFTSLLWGDKRFVLMAPRHLRQHSCIGNLNPIKLVPSSGKGELSIAGVWMVSPDGRVLGPREKGMYSSTFPGMSLLKTRTK